jgi:hypothetical protein
LRWLEVHSYHLCNEEGRNPTSAQKYGLEEVSLEVREAPENHVLALTNAPYDRDLYEYYYYIHPHFVFEVIAQTLPIIVKYGPVRRHGSYNIVDEQEVLIFFPSVIADVEEGEYVNRRFALIFGVWDEDAEDYEWGMLPAGDCQLFLEYVGYSRLTAHAEDTCVHGRAEATLPEGAAKYFRQRKACEGCSSPGVRE